MPSIRFHLRVLLVLNVSFIDAVFDCNICSNIWADTSEETETAVFDLQLFLGARLLLVSAGDEMAKIK